MNARLFAILKFLRISALPSALADICGGLALALFAQPLIRFGWTPLFLALTTLGIYLGGMASNDLLHAAKDRALGKPRPLATGALDVTAARAITVALYALGLIGAWLAGCLAAAALLAALTLAYNAISAGRVVEGRHVAFGYSGALGALLIAACRGLHVLLPLIALGVLTRAGGLAWLFAGSVAAYFALVLTLSLFEERGGARAVLWFFQFALLPVTFALPAVVLWRGGGLLVPWLGVGVLAANVGFVHRALGVARREPTARNFGRAVGVAIRGECLMMAGFAFLLAPGQPWLGLIAVALYPLADWLGRYVSPT